MSQPLGAAFMLGAQGSTTYEILRKCQWFLDIQGIPSLLSAQTCNLPRYELEAVDVYYYNDKIKLASRPNPSDVTCTLLDFVSPDVVGALWTWFKQIYNPNTGAMGYSSQYKRHGNIYLYDPAGNLQRTWSCTGMWPKNSPTPEEPMSYTDAHETTKIALTLSVDYATLDGTAAANILS